MNEIAERPNLAEDLEPETQSILEENHFDADAFFDLWRRFRNGEIDSDSNAVDGDVEPPRDADSERLPERDSDEAWHRIQLGRKALKEGKVGVVVLNGGMATRFGEVVKGCVEVFDGHSFLELKLRDACRHGDKVDVLLMNSFATNEASRQHIEENDYFGCPSSSIHPFLQNVSIRLTPEGDLFRRDDGTVSLYSPGHGDMPDALNRGPLEDFLERGGEYLMMSNVDNLLATLDPLVIGSHIKASSVSDVEMTVEAVEATPDDAGGKPARVDGSLEIVESFRFPEEFDWEDIPVFNTNTFMFNAEALQQDFGLGWYLVEKTVQGRTAIQFERLAGELSHFLKTKVLRVPREGDQARFQPIKTRDDLANNRERIKRILTKRGFEES